MHVLYGTHPYHTTAPTPAVINAASSESLKVERTRRFRPERGLLIVIGDVDVAATKKTVAKVFGGWKPTGEAAPALPLAPPMMPGRHIYLVDRPGSVQSSIIVGRPAIGQNDPAYYAAEVANTIFGGLFGSRLTKNIREDKGYTYSPYSALVPRQLGALLYVGAQVRNEVTGPHAARDLLRARSHRRDHPHHRGGDHGQALRDGQLPVPEPVPVVRGLRPSPQLWINGQPPEMLNQYVTKINAVTVPEIIQIGPQPASPRPTRRSSWLAMRPRSGMSVTQFGPVTELKN